ncbi:MAG: DUF5723 family protein [Bacteroidia bacterium]
MKKLILLITIFFCGLLAEAQTNLTFYNFNSVAQSNLLNPALPSRQGFTLGLLDFYGHGYVPGVTMYDIFRKDETQATTVDKLLSNPNYHLRDMQFNSEINPLFLGFRIRKNYFSFGIQNTLNHNIGLPKDILGLVYYGNGSTSKLFGKPVNIGELDVEMSAITSIHAAYSRDFGDKLSIGIRAKYNIGIYHTKVIRNQTTLLTDSGENGAIRLNASTDYEAVASGVDRIEDLGNAPNSADQIRIATDYLNKPVGSGYSFDFGVNYKANSKLSLSASVLDLGVMNWYNGKNYSRKATFTYEGVLTDDPTKLDSAFEDLADSVGKIFEPIEKTGSYTTSFNPKVYLGLNYNLYKSGTLGLVAYGEMWKGKFYPGASIAFTQRVWKILELKVNYNMYREQYSNIGAGFALHLGPISMYAMSDNMLGNYNWEKTHYSNTRVGLNINIGNRFDRDNDGVPDRKDKCKTIPGTRLMKGCPDADKDLVADNEDDCPTVKGSPKAKGCPDADGDGVKDASDSCVSVKGDPLLHGCPDTDGDGVADYKDQCPSIKGLPENYGCPDKDDDGVLDKDDACPEKAGPRYLDGCPDMDKDSVADRYDACPAVPGLIQFNGCPDTDGDGIINSKDSCMVIAGLAIYSGCPDTDGDSIPDYRDLCPLEAGKRENNGCPKIEPNVVVLTVEEQKVINEAFSNLEFEVGTSKIAEKSLNSLEELATLLISKPLYKLEINGHTDNVGNAAANLKLSQSRANAVKSFLTSKGVSTASMKATGFGSKKPIGDNKTAEGRQRNRRVEFKIVK